MGSHDYTCNVCGTPASYQCGEASGDPCVQDGIGDDSVFVDVYTFLAADASEDPSMIDARLASAPCVLSEHRGYDWSEWELTPSLNYRTVLMGMGDPLGIWPVRPMRAGDEGTEPVGLALRDDEMAWAVTWCPPCRARYADSSMPALPCRLECEAVSRHLGVPFTGDKALFVEAVRTRVATRLPAKR